MTGGRCGVYSSGISNGGMKAYKLGCELSDQIAAIAPIEGCLYSTQKPLTSPVSVIAFHGKQDFLDPYNGGVGSMYGYTCMRAAIQVRKFVYNCATETMCRFFFAHPSSIRHRLTMSVATVDWMQRWQLAVNDLMIGG